MTKTEHVASLAEILTLTAENFQAELSEAMVQMLISELIKLPLAEVRRGMTTILRTRKFSSFPTLAEIIEACRGGNEREAIEAEAEQQWLLAQAYQPPAAPYHRVFLGYDDDHQPRYEDPSPSGLTPEGQEALKAIGGPGRVDQVRYARRDFIEAYRRLKAHGLRRIEGTPELKALADGLRQIGEAA
jgi:hypothetical protein